MLLKVQISWNVTVSWGLWLPTFRRIFFYTEYKRTAALRNIGKYKRNTSGVLIFPTFSKKFKWISNLLNSYSLSVPEIKYLSFIPQISHYYILPQFLTSPLQSLVFVSVSHRSSKDSMCCYRPTKINCSYRIPVKSVTESTVQSRREIPLFGTPVRWSKT